MTLKTITFSTKLEPLSPPILQKNSPKYLRPAIYVTCITLLLASIAYAFWEGGIKDQFIPRNFGVVEPGFLYRSGQISPRMLEPTLTAHGIDRIIFMSGDNLKRHFVIAEIETAKRLGISRTNYPLGGDGLGKYQRYVGALVEIMQAKQAGQQVLVHCHAGSQRTGGVIALYHLLIKKSPMDQVLQDLTGYGHDPAENPKLIPYLNANMHLIAQGLVDQGVIDQLPSPMPVIPMP